MNTDSYFEIGSNHKICMDYALHGKYNGLHYLIGADGCSSSALTDVGARIVAHIGKVCLQFLSSLTIEKGAEVALIQNLLRMGMRRMIRELNLCSENLDATLWVLGSRKEYTFVIAWGDGVLVRDYKDEEFSAIRFQYLSGAPYYLSYTIDEKRRENYLKTFKEPTVTEYIGNLPEESKGFCTEPFIHIIENNNWKSLSICSDGINSYKDAQNNPIPVEDIIKRWIAYKSTVGEFVNRRMLKLKREFLKEGIKHTDDVFCASIVRDD